MHRLLERQLKRHFGSLDKVPDAMRPFLAIVDATYTDSDSDRALAERSLELASQELLQSNQSIRKQQHEQQVIFDTVPATILYKDADNRILRINEMGARQLGRPAAELEGMRTEDLFPADLAKALHDDDLEVIRSGQPKLGIVESHPGPAGLRWVRTDKMPYRDDAGAIVGVIVLSVDITENRRAEEALRRSEEQYRLLVETATEGLWSLDPAGNTTFVNQVMADMLGVPREKMAGRNVMEFVAEADQAEGQEKLGAILKGTALRLDFRFRRADGEPVWTQASGAPILRDGQLIGVLGMVTDITQRKQAEEKLQRAYEALKQVDRERTQFLNNAAHELNTPLTPIKLQIHMLRTRDASHATPQRAVEILDRNFDRLAHLVKDLLDSARIQARQLPLHMAPMDLAQVVQQTFDTYRPLALATGIALQVDATGPMPLLGDAGRLSQVLDNLVSNAVKFTPPGGTIRLRGAAVDGIARVEVQDSGRGIRPEDLGRLFKPFSQVHDPMQQMVPGTGLGLYISRSIVEAHGGTMQAASRGRDQGCTFSLALPLQRGRGIEMATSKAG